MYLRMTHRRLGHKSPVTNPENILGVTVTPNLRVAQKGTSGFHYLLREAHRSRNIATSGETIFFFGVALNYLPPPNVIKGGGTCTSHAYGHIFPPSLI